MSFTQPQQDSLFRTLRHHSKLLSQICTTLGGGDIEITHTYGEDFTGTINGTALDSGVIASAATKEYRKLSISFQSAINFTTAITLTDGSTWTHTSNTSEFYSLELESYQAPISQVIVTDLSAAGNVDVAINLLTK